MIRFAGFAHCSYDFFENRLEHFGPCDLPDKTACSNVPSDSAVFFNVLVHHGAKLLRSSTRFVLVPNDLEEKAIVEQLRTCLADKRNNRAGRVYCTNCGAKTDITKASCSRCGAKQFSIEFFAAQMDHFYLQVERQAKKLFALQESVKATRCFRQATNGLLKGPVSLISSKASIFNYVLFRNRIWTTKEFLSPKEWNALVRDHDERKEARLHSVVDRQGLRSRRIDSARMTV